MSFKENFISGGIGFVAFAMGCSVFSDIEFVANDSGDSDSIGISGGNISRVDARVQSFDDRETTFTGSSQPSNTDSKTINTPEIGGANEKADSGGPKDRVTTGCGDGRVVEPEKCDLAIPEGSAGHCPRKEGDCPSPEGCLMWRFNEKTGCDAECMMYSLTSCSDGDECCPPGCDSTNDDDCSSDCGDGILQEGETCELVVEPNSNIPVCPTKCEDDDDDPCTKNLLSGSAENCRSTCTKITISSIDNGDGCCPVGATPNIDTDCRSVCGDGIPEGDEECDGSPGCNDRCKLTITLEQKECIEKYSDTYTNEGCDVCMCVNCRSQVEACYGSDDPVKNKYCDDVILCGYSTGCLGSVCYCGTASGWASGMCLIPEAANGPCKRIIEEAGGTNDIIDIFEQQLDTSTALGRAQAISDCVSKKCLMACE